jgi:hypothetical protein
MPVHLKPFDASRDFVALRNFRFNGDIIMRRDVFDKGLCTERKLQQLYETRHIGYPEDNQIRSVPPRSPRERARAERVPSGPEAAEALERRIAELEKKHSRKELEALGGDDLKAALAKLPNKAAVAKALIEAGRAEDDGTA